MTDPVAIGFGQPSAAEDVEVRAAAAPTSAESAVASTIDRCRTALESAEMVDVLDVLRRRGLAEAHAVAAIEAVGRDPDGAKRVARLRDSLFGAAAQTAALERCLLLQTAVGCGPLLARASMGESVMRCLADELRFLAMPDTRDVPKLLAPSDGFVAFAKIVTLRRFPAGQLQFERSGIPLSWFLRLGPRRLTTVVRFLGRFVGGRRPFFFHHIAWRRPNRMFLLEREQNRSYWRIAQSLARHPDVKGLLTESWLHSPDTFEVSSHLAWLNTPFLEHGGLIVVLGRAAAESGVFTSSPHRKRLSDQGHFRPTTAMAIWPRAAMLDWASNHPEFAT
jgi:hypothetical protein